MKDFDLREICLFADKVFEVGEPESVVIIGRRRALGATPLSTVKYRRVREVSASSFTADSDFDIPISEFQKSELKDFRSPDLPEVWAALRSNPRLSSVALVGQGFSFATKGLILEARRLGSRKSGDAVRAFIDGHTHTDIWEVPKSIWLSPTRTPVGPWRSGSQTGSEQVLVNYIRAMRGPWRLKAFLDREGRASINTYSTVRPKAGGPDAVFLWALLNSPVANAYLYCATMQKHNSESLLSDIPLPRQWEDHVSQIVSAARNYLSKATPGDAFALQSDQGVQLRELLLALDAEVLRAYGLPARLERSLLDQFNLPATKKMGRRRKGVGCSFGDYYPAGFKSLVPLHKFISPAYRNSTVDQVAKRFTPGGSPVVTAALDAAAEAFGGDD